MNSDGQEPDDADVQGEGQFRAIFEGAALGICLTELDGRLIEANRVLYDMLGYRDHELRGRLFTDFTHPDDAVIDAALLPELLDGQRDQYQVEKRYIRADGEVLWARLMVSLLRARTGAPRYVVILVQDISQEHQEKEQLRHRALYDPLTDLPNRLLFDDRLQHAIVTAQRTDSSFALLMLDLDDFKSVNDTLGHQCGDQLLQQVGQRLQHILRESDTLARLGGDEFAVILPAADIFHAILGAHRILHTLREPFSLEGHHPGIQASIGITLYPHNGTDAALLLRQADSAMYAAKRAQLGYVIYNEKSEMAS